MFLYKDVFLHRMSVWSEPGRALLFVRNVPAVGVCLSVTLSHTEVCDMRTAGGIRGRIRQRDASQKGAAGVVFFFFLI